MLATSWKAKGLVRQAWLRLDVKQGHREKLSELTGIPPPNLSGMNSGRLPMTMEMAQRITDVIPGLSVLELGAPEEQADAEGETLLSRLGELAAAHAAAARKQTTMARDIALLQERVRRLEARPWPAEAQSMDPE